MPPVLGNIATIVTFGALVALGVAAIVASRRSEGQHNRSGDALWDDLRRAHGLSRREVRLLRSAAERASLDPKTVVFLEPYVLMHLIEKHNGERCEVQELMAKLYS